MKRSLLARKTPLARKPMKRRPRRDQPTADEKAFMVQQGHPPQEPDGTIAAKLEPGTLPDPQWEDDDTAGGSNG